MSAPSSLSPQAKEQLTQAFKTFRARLQDIADAHRTTIKKILSSADAKRVQETQNRIQHS